MNSKYTNKLRSSGMRPTRQRIKICEILFDREHTFHFSINDLAEIVKNNANEKIALATIGLYLFEGIIGLPVFSGTPEKGIGLAYFMGPTMGYLIGFLAAVFFAGYFKYSNNFLENFIKITFATSLIYLLGLISVSYTHLTLPTKA